MVVRIVKFLGLIIWVFLGGLLGGLWCLKVLRWEVCVIEEEGKMCEVV